jgi:hypothetical protein
MPSESTPPSSSKNSNEPIPAIPSEVAPAEINSGTILERWGITARQLTDLVNENPSLRGMMLGYVAEHKFQQLVEAHPHISSSKKHDDHDRSRKHDRVIIFKGMEFTIEVKSLQTNLIEKIDGRWTGRAQVDGSDRRIVKFPDGTELNTTLLLRGQFDILAVNCFAFENKWHFAFALNRDLPQSRCRKYTQAQRDGLIASLIPVTWPPEPPFVLDPFELVDRLYRERSKPSGGTSASRS